MHLLTTVIRGPLSCLRHAGRKNVLGCKVTDTNVVTKLKYQVYSRVQATASLPGFMLKPKSLVVICQPRQMYMNVGPGEGPKMIKKFTPLYHKDSVPRDYEIIYQSELGEKQARLFMMMAALFLSYASFFVFLLLYFNGEWTFYKKSSIPYLNLEIPTLTVQMLTSLTFCILIVAYIISGYARLLVKRIYESPCKSKYIGILKKNAFRTERVEFDMSDVKNSNLSKQSLHKKGNVSIKGRSYIVFAPDFIVPKYFNQFVGVDPMIQGKIGTNNSESLKKIHGKRD